MNKEDLRTAVQRMDTYQFGQKKELTNKLSKVTSYVPKKEVLDLVSKLDKQVVEQKITEHQAWEKVAEGYAPADPQELIDVLTSYYTNDEPEITEEQAWNKIAESYPADVRSLVTSFQHFYYGDFIKNPTLSKKETVEVPQFVADWIEFCKKNEASLAECLTAMNIDHQRAFNWINSNRSDMEEIVARAWLNGYTIEPEKLYYVKLKGDAAEQLLIGTKRYLNILQVSSGQPYTFDKKTGYSSAFKTKLTEQEKDYWIERLNELPLEVVEVMENKAKELIEGWKEHE